MFLGRLMVAWEPLRSALARGGSEQAVDHVALLHAATDWYRVQVPRLLGPDVLSYLYRAYRRELTGAAHDDPVSAASYNDALQWAMTAPTADRPRMIDLQDIPGGQRYAPHPLLAVIADDLSDDVSWPVSNVLWSYADGYLAGDQRRSVGYSALARGAYQAAARLLDHDDTTVAPDAYYRIAKLFSEHRKWRDGREWWHKAIGTGHSEVAPLATLALGFLEVDQGNFDQARHWYQEAISTGHPEVAAKSMVNLGVLEADQGNFDQARHWYQQAISTGHPEVAAKSMVNLGVLEADQGNFDQARHWYQEAISTGHPEAAPSAMGNLGNLEKDQGNLDQARHWYQQAISTGQLAQAARAMLNFGVLERDAAILTRPGTGISRPSAPASSPRQPERC